MPLRLLKFGKVRYGKKPKPVFFERNGETLLHKITEADTIIPPAKISEFIKDKFNGRVEQQSDLLKVLAEKFNCSERTAQRAIKEAVKLDIVQEKKRGTKKEYRVNIR